MSGSDYFKPEPAVIKAILEKEYGLELVSHEYLFQSLIGGCMKIEARCITNDELGELGAKQAPSVIQDQSASCEIKLHEVKDYICKVIDLTFDYNGHGTMCHPEVQAAVMAQLKEKGMTCSQPVPTRDGRIMVDFPKGKTYVMQLLTYLPGEVRSDKQLDNETVFELGVLTAKFRQAMRGLKHSAIQEESAEELINGIDLNKIKKRCEVLKNEDITKNILSVVAQYKQRLWDHKDKLERGMCHGDMKNFNVVRIEGVPNSRPVVEKWGLIDFGLTHYFFMLYDLQFILVLLMLFSQDDPFAAAKNVIAGYNSVEEISNEEKSLLQLGTNEMCARIFLISVAHPTESSSAEMNELKKQYLKKLEMQMMMITEMDNEEFLSLVGF